MTEYFISAIRFIFEACHLCGFKHILRRFAPLYMRIRYIVIFLFLVSWSLQALAQKEAEKKLPRILILLDESSSMLEKWDGNTPRYKAAGKIILSLMDS